MTEIRRLSRKSLGTANGRRSRAVINMVLTDLDRTRRDAGISLRRLAIACGVSQSFLSQIFAGEREPSIAVLTAISASLGGDLSVRFYPSGGPQIHDRIQARIGEGLLRIASPSWNKHVEVAVTRPARGFVDVAFDSTQLATLVATEVETRLDRLEQQVRRAQDKAMSLPSSDLWQHTPGERTVYRLLVLRSSSANREIARRFASTLQAAYPARAADVYASLTGTGIPWPGHGILWADVRGDHVTILDRPPRGVTVGR